MIGAPDHVVVVLDDHQRVAVVAQAVQDRDQPAHFRGMEAERGLVEHVKGIDQAGAQDLGQADALELAGRERARGAVERQVIEPDLRQVAEPAIDLCQDGSRGRLAPRRRPVRR